MRLTIICDNTVGRPIPAIGEHGFACFIESPEHNWLFDTGRGHSLLHNLSVLDIDPKKIDRIVLSHGHNDHVGGLESLLEQIGRRPVYAHRQIFSQRYWQGQHERRNISIPFKRQQLEAKGADFIWVDHFQRLSQTIFISGRIPRKHPEEKGDSHLVCTSANGRIETDQFPDDMALALLTGRGLIVLFGCAHAGFINTIEHFRQHLPNCSIHAVVGGTHLGPVSDAQFTATISYLDTLSFNRLGLSHCTGQIRAAQLHARYPNKVFFANVGTIIECSDP